ncbi:unnamed protein product [Adineta ricciae]|uniref:Uncharacterized protein n=1 Tax=Adineta ricciae TaxID=249248 RepID=A0A815S3W3_ADIRI|nr:unnamed protein product [Adineta ricciae]CAF1486644.1 unnamed protein product [Adineta ricciae]
MFDQELRSDSDFWKLVKEKEIIDKEDLPVPIPYLSDNINNDSEDNDDLINADVAASSSINHSPTEPASSASSEETSETRHDRIRRVATRNYSNFADKKMKRFQNSTASEVENFSSNDCVGVKIQC